MTDILEHLDFEHLRFLINNFHSGKQGEQKEKRVATKIHILALCKALDREPTNADFRCKLKENEPEEKEGGYREDAETNDTEKDDIWEERAEELRKRIGILQTRQISEIKLDMIDEGYIEKTDRKHHKITQKGESLLQLYADGLKLQAKISQFYVIKNKKMAGALQSIPAWRYDSGKADKKHVEEQLSEGENPGKKVWKNDPLKPLLRLDAALGSIENELAHRREKVEIKLESVEDDSVAHEVPEKMKDIEEKISGIGDEEKEEILMLLRGRY